MSLLFLIYSIRLALLEETLSVIAGGLSSKGGGIGGGGKFCNTVCFKAYSYYFSSSSASFIFNCNVLSWLFSAWAFTWCRIVSSTIKFVIYLSFKSSWVSLRESKIYCHSGGMLLLLNCPVFKSKAIALWTDMTYPDCITFGSLGSSENKPFTLLNKLPSFFFSFA